ncbi:MAG: hypothetical protein WAV05_08330 [Anaerolineales bacterium]
MIKMLSSRLFWGLVLVFGGVLLLLDTIGIFEGGALFWTIATGVVGVLFLWVYFPNHDNWWALIPGVIFLAISATIGLTSFLPGFSESNMVGTIILGGIAFSFLLVYLANHTNWWAIIPAGVMATITIVAVLDSGTSGIASGGVFFLGLGITFALVAILPNSVGPMRWSWIPAAILGLFGVILLFAAESYLNYIWPSAFILAGIFLVIRSLARR